jgi:hypothetical protein
MPPTDLELLPVGRICIDLYCDQLGAARLRRRAAIVTKVAAAARLGQDLQNAGEVRVWNS